MYAELARTGNAFTFDINQNMVGNTGYILTVPENEKDNLMYLLAFLNSRTTLYCLNQITSRFDENGWRWLHQFVEQLYVPMFVDKNKIVASIYHFTKEEEVYINQTLSKY